MPAKFKESVKVVVDRQSRKMKTVHYYLKNTPTQELVAAVDNSNTKPKNLQKFRNELTRRGVSV
jgi:hypothetical protein|tara:strand:+ start:1180 stop:1371 length:192 start_codon:yes stop_codon:yes gene_type:complete